jgi:hypothetical protein
MPPVVVPGSRQYWYHSLDSEDMTCSGLTFKVSARNEAGESEPGTADAGFPVIVPERFPLSVKVLRALEVTVTFTLPQVCSYQEAHYRLVVYASSLATDPVYDGGGQAIDTNQEVEVHIPSELLQRDTSYYAVVTINNTLKSVSSIVPFSKCF